MAVAEGPGAEAFDHLLGQLAASAAVARWGQAVFDVYVGQSSHTLAAHVDLLIDAAGLGPRTRALELAAGAGGFGCYVAARTGCTLEGIDWSVVGVRLANERARRLGIGGRATFRRADLRELRPPAASYDAIFGIDATYFGVDLAELAAAVAGALRADGCFAALVTVPSSRLSSEPRQPPLGLPTEVDLVAILAGVGLSATSSCDLTDSYAELVERMSRRWAADLPALRRELGRDVADARLAEDQYLLSLLQAGALRRSLLVARRPIAS